MRKRVASTNPAVQRKGNVVPIDGGTRRRSDEAECLPKRLPSASLGVYQAGEATRRPGSTGSWAASKVVVSAS